MIKLIKKLFQNNELYKKGFDWCMLQYFEEGKTFEEIKSFNSGNKDFDSGVDEAINVIKKMIDENIIIENI